MNEWMFGHIHLYSFFPKYYRPVIISEKTCFFRFLFFFFDFLLIFSYITSHPYPIHSFKTEPYSLSLWFWFFLFCYWFPLFAYSSSFHFIHSIAISQVIIIIIIHSSYNNNINKWWWWWCRYSNRGRKKNEIHSFQPNVLAPSICVWCVFSVDNSATKHLHVNYLDIHWTFTTGFFHYYYSTWICWLAATYSIFCLEWKRIV